MMEHPVELWAARDSDGSVWIYPEKPVLDGSGTKWTCSQNSVLRIESLEFLDLKNGPKRICICEPEVLEDLYNDGTQIVHQLVDSRINHSKESENLAILRMETFMVRLLQTLACITQNNKF